MDIDIKMINNNLHNFILFVRIKNNYQYILYTLNYLKDQYIIQANINLYLIYN